MIQYVNQNILFPSTYDVTWVLVPSFSSCSLRALPFYFPLISPPPLPECHPVIKKGLAPLPLPQVRALTRLEKTQSLCTLQQKPKPQATPPLIMAIAPLREGTCGERETWSYKCSSTTCHFGGSCLL